MPTARKATVDLLAQRLSEMTGTQFEVLRGRYPVRDPWGAAEGQTELRYQLKATRDGYSYVFQGTRPMDRHQLQRWLASICDMVNMGYIPVRKD